MAKVKENIVGLGNFIGKNKIPLLYIGGAIAVVSIAYPLIKNITSGFKSPKVKGAKDVTKDVVVDDKKTSITDFQANQYAEQLLSAFNAQMGTDLSRIENVFEKLNSEDFKKVYKEFGTRTYSNLSSGSPSGFLFSLPEKLAGVKDMDLIGWIDEELDFTDASTKNIIRKVVEPAGFVIG